MTDIDRMIYDRQFQRSPAVNYPWRHTPPSKTEIADLMDQIDRMNKEGKVEEISPHLEVNTEVAPGEFVVNMPKGAGPQGDGMLSEDNIRSVYMPLEEARAIQDDVHKKRQELAQQDFRSGRFGSSARKYRG